MLEKWVQELKDGEQELIAWRRYLHQHPELSFEETNTSAFIADQLRSFGIEVRTNVGGNGVLGF